ncbi:alpha/beta hydrolase [Neiella marina]|uniref:Alpha/beta hydrolase n=1 Tax=Neiella marina TaxID=508461 RepID=A0A8J2XMJ0_9GAMM|nr:alpha/beta family hydrolase [Neiella marina]GGA78909.1 alpha/beta hydrolase [Neiella marina]
MKAKPVARVLLAHGAGAGSDSEFMQELAGQLSAQHIEPVLFDFPYMLKAKELNRKRPPDRLPVLLQAMTEQVESLPADLPLFLAGKSMGGRVATMLLETLALPGIAYGYPFHPIGKPERLRVEHLQQLKQPLLIVQGERDTFGNQREVAEYPLSSAVQLAWLADGDHSFKPRKASGFSQRQHIERAAALSAQFIEDHLCTR